MLKIGFRTPDELPSPLSCFFEEPAAADLMEDGCFLEKRSDVARGISLVVVKLFSGVSTSNIAPFGRYSVRLLLASFDHVVHHCQRCSRNHCRISKLQVCPHPCKCITATSTGRSTAPLRGSDRRKLKQRIIQAYGISPDLGDLLVPDGLMNQKVATYTDDPGVRIPITSRSNGCIGAHPSAL